MSKRKSSKSRLERNEWSWKESWCQTYRGEFFSLSRILSRHHISLFLSAPSLALFVVFPIEKSQIIDHSGSIFACLTQTLQCVILSPEEWTPQNGFLTAAQKLQRKVILKEFEEEIKKVYP